MPDLDDGLYSDELDHSQASLWPFARRLSKQTKVLAAAAVVAVLFGVWMIFGGNSSDHQTAHESWQPAPPAASAPEAPRWDANAESKTDAITLDEVQTHRDVGKALPTAFQEISNEKPSVQDGDETSVKVIAKPPVEEIRPRVAANRPVVIGTPVPPAQAALSNQDWNTMDTNEYYWAVRRRSEAALNARNAQHGDNTARLNGVIETPAVRMY